MSKLKTIVLFLLTICLNSCFSSDSKSEKIISPSGEYYFSTFVNRTDKSKKNYADVNVNLYDRNGKMLSQLYTKAGDFNKWAINWNSENDTLILNSSDIGNSAWKISKNSFVEIKLDKQLNLEAEKIFKEKYK